MKDLFESPADNALNKLFDLASKLERDKRKLENTLDSIRKLLLKGKTEEALQIIVKGEKEDDKRSQGKVNEHIF